MQKETGKRTVGEGREQQKISEKACYIVGAGSFEKLDSLPQEGDLVIAADGGYAYLKQLGIQPDVLLGDFDSSGVCAGTRPYPAPLTDQR